MTSIVKFQSLSGDDEEAPHCHLLQIDDFKFLLDCGWDEANHEKIIDNLKRHARQIDAILISHPDLNHCGLLPYMTKLGINCPIYMTVPACKMGQMFMYDFCQSRTAVEDFNLFSLDDVDSVFDRVVQLKHNQTEAVRGQDYGLQIMPVQAGHMIGGTSWKITKDDEEEFVYCVDVNHKRETHLNGLEIERLDKPSLLITDGYNYGYQQERRAKRTEKLVQRLQSTTSKGGNVLITTDTAGRALEMALVLEGLWADERFGLSNVNLVMVSNVAQSTIDAAKGMIEWMSEKIIQKFTHKRENAFEFMKIQIKSSIQDVQRIPEPKVILATPIDMETGFSRELFVLMAGHPKNALIMTNRAGKASLCRKLIENEGMSSITLEMKKRVPLAGPELEEFERNKLEAMQEEEAKKREIESSDESDTEDSSTKRKTQSQHDIMMPHHATQKEGGFFKKARKTFPMFPFSENRIKWDDYGEIINPDDYRLHEAALDGDQLNLNSLAATQQSITFGRIHQAEQKEEDQEEEEEKVPTKCIKTREQVSIRCNIEFIDFEGRVDGESQLQLLSTIRPKEIILIRSKRAFVERFVTDLKAKVPGLSQVHVPKPNQIVDATKERHIFQLKLKDSLLSNLNFVRVGDKEIEVAWVKGRVDYFGGRLDVSDDEMEVDEPKEEKIKMDDIPTLQPLPYEEQGEHESIFINDTKLTELKHNLQKHGILAEFIGGNLVCNGKVAIKRSTNGVVQIEGALSEDYFYIRKLVYNNYAVV